MKKVSIGSALTSVLLVGGLYGCAFVPDSQSAPIEASITETSGKYIELVIYDSGTANMKGGDWAEFRFPKLFADNNGVVADKVVEDLNESILNRVADFQSAAEVTGPAVKDLEYELEIKVTDIYSDSNLLVVNLSSFQYLGNAHGSEELWTKAYRVSDQSEISLDEEINPDSLVQLSELIAVELEKNYSDSLNHRNAKLRQKLTENSKPYVWEISSSGVIVWLPAYAYTAGYVGNPSVSISWQDFEKILREDSVLRKTIPTQIE